MTVFDVSPLCSAGRLSARLAASDGTFRRLWGEDKTESSGSWEWKCISPAQAKYVGIKWIPDQEAAEDGMDTLGDLQHKVLNAYLVWGDEQPS